MNSRYNAHSMLFIYFCSLHATTKIKQVKTFQFSRIEVNLLMISK